jgi:type IV secretory pathway VirB2 component (pilin)
MFHSHSIRRSVRRIVHRWSPPPRLLAVAGLVLLLGAIPALADTGSPFETIADKLMQLFVGPIAKAFAVIAVVVGGLMFAFGEMGGKKMLAGLIAGVGMALGAVNVIAWLFGGIGG